MDESEFEIRLRRRREEAKKRSSDSLDEFFGALEEGGEQLFKYYEKSREDVIKMSFLLGLLGGLVGGGAALGVYILLFS